MENLGLMQHVDAVSSCSGGSWAASIYMFADLPLDTLLGDAADPNLLTEEALSKVPAALGNVLTHSTSTIAAKLFASGMEYPDFWMKFVAQFILSPFNLDDATSYMAADDDHIARIKGANPQLSGARFMAPAPGRPKTFVMLGALLAPTGYIASSKSVVSLQMSPDYAGSPFYPDSHSVNYQPLPGQSWPELENLMVGGGLVESFAFGGKQPVQQNGGSEVTMAASQEPFSLAKAVGISSNGPASTFTQSSSQQRLSALNALGEYWPITTKERPGPQDSMTYQFGDGGNLDNSALLQMLQRGAERVIVVTSTDLPLPKQDFCSMLGVNEMVDFVKNTKGHPGELEWTYRASFGFYTEDDTIGQFLTQNQVFKREELAPTLCEMQKRKAEGAPVVVSRDLRVQQNSWWGIEEYDVSVIFVYNEKSANFESQLPAETQAELAKGKHGKFANYPFYTLFFQNKLDALSLSNAQVNLLGAQSEYAVTQNEDLFRKLLGIDGTDLTENQFLTSGIQGQLSVAACAWLIVGVMLSVCTGILVASKASRRSTVGLPKEPLLG